MGSACGKEEYQKEIDLKNEKVLIMEKNLHFECILNIKEIN